MEIGWIPGRYIDNSDAQYRTFRAMLPMLSLVMVLQVGISKILDRIFPNHYALLARSQEIYPKTIWSLIFSLLFVFIAFGMSAVKVLILLTLFYWFIKLRPSSQSVIIGSWTYCIALLFLNYWYGGYKFQWISNSLRWMVKEA